VSRDPIIPTGANTLTTSMRVKGATWRNVPWNHWVLLGLLGEERVCDARGVSAEAPRMRLAPPPQGGGMGVTPANLKQLAAALTFAPRVDARVRSAQRPNAPLSAVFATSTPICSAILNDHCPADFRYSMTFGPSFCRALCSAAATAPAASL